MFHPALVRSIDIRLSCEALLSNPSPKLNMTFPLVCGIPNGVYLKKKIHLKQHIVKTMNRRTNIIKLNSFSYWILAKIYVQYFVSIRSRFNILKKANKLDDRSESLHENALY